MDTIQLNSTAVATASSEISGSVIECLAGFISSDLDSVGNISLWVRKINMHATDSVVTDSLYR